MSEHHHEFPKTTATQVILAVLGGLFAPALIIFLVVKLILGIQANYIEDTDAGTSSAVVEERIKPVATVEVAAASSGPRVDKSGEEVVTAVCSACHAAGALGSPKIGDKAAWGPRIAQGYETLVKHAVEGIRQMPARGGNPDLSDTEVASAVAYMANKSGAKFAAPAPAKAASTEAPPTEKAAPAEQAAAPETKAPAAPAPVAPAAAKANAAGKTGEEVVTTVCSACHAAGVMGSPKLGDKAAWAPRIAQGYETLVKHAISGIRMMPAKGGNPSLSDAEVARAVAHMANQAGAKFTPPEN